uniref:Uncharacterized protein n=1 Tax=viral metagenome TaxID=1070528 RepID=A0A6C0ARQ3_9ZZZZ
MGKKCIPGLFCIENMTLFIMVVVIVIIIYYFYSIAPKDKQTIVINNSIPQNPNMWGVGLATRLDPFNDPYAPPLKNDALFYPPNSSDIRGQPVIAPPSMYNNQINVQTRGLNTSYQQVGILTKSSGNQENMILPLMGRRTMVGRDKWQYYTMSNTGNISTKLPISVNGRSCTSENGCDSINNGDVVYVEGYDSTFRVTVYENNLFQYLPVL